MAKNYKKYSEKKIFGMNVVPYFFALKENTLPNLVQRILPMIPENELEQFEVVVTENEQDRTKKNFYYGHIVAQPDAVFFQNSKLNKKYISVEYKSLSNSHNQSHEPNKWVKQIRLKDMLQCVIAGLQVSAVKNLTPTACVLRYPNVCYMIFPDAELCKYILEQAPKVKAFKSEPGARYVAASVLAQTIVEDVKQLFSGKDKKEDESGKIAHEKMFS